MLLTLASTLAEADGPTVSVAVGGALEMSSDASVGTAFAAGGGLDIGRLRLAALASYMPDSATPDHVQRGLWRLGPEARVAVTRHSALWVGLGAGLAVGSGDTRPFGRMLLGYAFGWKVPLGAYAGVETLFEGLFEGASFLLLGIRFDGSLHPPAPARVARATERNEPAAHERPAPRPLVPGTPLAPDVVREGIVEHRQDIESCVALAERHGNAVPPRIDLQLLIAPDGEVQRVEVLGAGAAQRALERCVNSRVRFWTFPSAQGHTIFNAPFLVR